MRKIIGLFALMIGLLVAVAASSAHFAYFEADRGVHIQVVPDDSELIDLRPMQPYAYINDNGMLVIDLSKYNGNWQEGLGEGVSPNSTYVFKEVFGVSNDLWEGTPICMHITYSGDGGVKFFVGNYTGQPGETTLDVTVMPGEVVPIGLILDSTGLVDGDAINGQVQFYAVPGPCDEE
ncbi:DUF1102 domain-containing protein [Thermococcus thioreducens]|uniref:DUF1102 domain-containing protein n=1 Tax=Thermococcus thioreducens TaxID=277988 RepID=A0A0Q2MS96_9EURY|nr:DUF1102 domain-containing protein [Thermococcus thioreducens]ASJ11656.1 hypothetical protein A3L14_01575 [Thermococcus thioreducens]KQH82607.1 hypothetical protein AMR53_04860 [Thermococcus thioreducens]SEW16141.1 Protein of unknown function [Thermococcus thioreducens]